MTVRIRLLTLPKCDLAQREREIAVGKVDPEATATVIERILDADPIVMIEHIDEFGTAWLEVEFVEADGIHCYSLTIRGDQSQEPFDQ